MSYYEDLQLYSEQYKKLLKELSNIGKQAGEILKAHYTEDIINEFSSKEEFLDDVNEMCGLIGFTKELFIKSIVDKYFKEENK